MSSSVVNAVIQYDRPVIYPQSNSDSHHNEMQKSRTRKYEINEDYTSYKIIEMLKHDKFMSGVDSLNDASLNDASAEINKNMHGDGQIYNSDGSDG